MLQRILCARNPKPSKPKSHPKDPTPRIPSPRIPPLGSHPKLRTQLRSPRFHSIPCLQLIRALQTSMGLTSTISYVSSV